MHVVESGRRAGFYTPAINWYHSHISVPSMEWTGSQLIFLEG